MFTKAQFGTTPAQDVLLPLVGKFKFPDSFNMDEVNNTIEKVVEATKMYGQGPNIVFTRALYDDVDGNFQKGAFVVRPSSRDKLEVDSVRREFTILAGEDFFDKLVKELAFWFDTYNHYFQLQTNLDAFNEVINKVVTENELGYDIKFSYGEGILDATTNSVVLGLSEEVIMDIPNFGCFKDDIRYEPFMNLILETLLEISKPYELVKVKTTLTKLLGIHSRRALSKLMRSFVTRDAKFVRVGTGYIDKEDTFAVVTKRAVTEEEASNAGEGVVVVNNEKATKKELEAGLTKILVSYKVEPFSKESGLPTELELTKAV